MTGKISEDADKVVDGTEKVAAAVGGANYGILISSIATFLRTLALVALAGPVLAWIPLAAVSARTPPGASALGAGR